MYMYKRKTLNRSVLINLQIYTIVKKIYQKLNKYLIRYQLISLNITHKTYNRTHIEKNTC